MKYKIVTEFPHQLLYESGKLSISLYQPTYRHRPENEKDPIVFKNHIQEVRNILLKEYKPPKVEEILKPLYELENDRMFWTHTEDGLAVFLNEDSCIVYKLPRRVEKFVFVSDNFHIKPLIRVFQSTGYYHVLCVNRKDIKLFKGNRYGLEEIEFPESIPTSLEDVLGDQKTQAYLSQGPAGGSGVLFHGHGGRQEEVNKDVDRYLRYVDRLILKNYSNVDKIPLVLVGLEQYQGHFRKISGNSHMLKKGIIKDYETLKLKDLEEESWKIIEDLYLERTRVLVERYRDSGEYKTESIIEVSNQAIKGRVETLLVESDRIIPGRINRVTGKIVDDGSEDLLDDLTKLVLEQSGQVVLLPKERMPSDTGVAAIYRY